MNIQLRFGPVQHLARRFSRPIEKHVDGFVLQRSRGSRKWPLGPGKVEYVSVNIGDPKGPIIEMNISLDSTDNYTAAKSVSINLEGVVPINQTPNE